MTEINTELRDELLWKHAEKCSPRELFKNFNYFFEKYKDSDCSHKVAGMYDAVPYGVRLIAEFRPEEGMKATIEEGSQVEYNTAYIEEQYTHHVLHIAMIKDAYGDKAHAALYAKKTLDMLAYFRPYLNEVSREKVIQENVYYRIASEIFNQNQKEWLEFLKDNSEGSETRFLFDWEKEIYKYPTHANENFQERISD